MSVNTNVMSYKLITIGKGVSAVLMHLSGDMKLILLVLPVLSVVVLDSRTIDF